jgi:FixJ family two-component response regulator
MSQQVTVYIVDDYEAMRDSLQSFLESEGFTVKTFASGLNFLKTYIYSPGNSDVLLLEGRMPFMSGLEIQSKLQENGAMIPIVFMSRAANVAMAVQALKAGAVDFIEKPFRQQVLLDSIQRALEIGTERRRETDMAAQARALLENLTVREHEVLERLVQGLANKSIAQELGISGRTVEVHRKHVMAKLQARSLPKVVRIVYQAERPFGDAPRVHAAV